MARSLGVLHVIRGTSWLLHTHGRWMGVNLLLAVLPFALAVVLFRHRGRRGPSWWIVLAAFVVLLPNAPYVMTDLVHLRPEMDRAPSGWAVALGLVPLYALFVLAGLESYTLSLHLVRRYLTGAGASWRRWAVPIEAGLHTACAVGVVMGRFSRLNSWDVLHPTLLARGAATAADRPLAVVGVLIAMVATSVALRRASGVAYRLASGPRGPDPGQPIRAQRPAA